MRVSAILIIIIFICATSIAFLYFGATKHVMMAEKLSDKPEEFFVVTNPDPVLLKAISTLERVCFYSFDETRFDELIGGEYGGANIEYQGNYYFVGIPIVEPDIFMFGLVFGISIFGLVTSTTLLVSHAIRKGSRQRK